MKWQQGCEQCRLDPEFQKKVDETCRQLEFIEEGKKEECRKYFPPSAVESQQQHGELTYMDVPFLSSDQVEKITGATPQSLQLTMVERVAEDAVTKIRRYFVRGEDFPPEVSILDYMGWRKVRFFSQSSSSHSKHVLFPENQIQPEQGSALLNMLEQRGVDGREVAPHTLRSLSELKARAQRLEDNRRSKDAAVAERLADLEDDEDAEVAAVNPEKKARLQQFAVAQAEAAPSMQGPPKRRKRVKDKDKDNQSAVLAGPTGPPGQLAIADGSVSEVKSDSRPGKKNTPSLPGSVRMDSATDAVIEKQMSHDAPLLKVCKYLGSVPECLPALSISKCMAGAKLGNQRLQLGAQRYLARILLLAASREPAKNF